MEIATTSDQNGLLEYLREVLRCEQTLFTLEKVINEELESNLASNGYQDILVNFNKVDKSDLNEYITALDSMMTKLTELLVKKISDMNDLSHALDTMEAHCKEHVKKKADDFDTLKRSLKEFPNQMELNNVLNNLYRISTIYTEINKFEYKKKTNSSEFPYWWYDDRIKEHNAYLAKYFQQMERDKHLSWMPIEVLESGSYPTNQAGFNEFYKLVYGIQGIILNNQSAQETLAAIQRLRDRLSLPQ